MKSLKRLLFEDQGQRKALPLSKFLPLLKQLEKWSPGIEYLYPGDSLGHASKKGPYLKAVQALKQYGKDSNIHVWTIGSPSISYNAGQQMVAGGMPNIIKYAQTNPLASVGISMVSNNGNRFGSDMASGKHWSLD